MNRNTAAAWLLTILVLAGCQQSSPDVARNPVPESDGPPPPATADNGTVDRSVVTASYTVESSPANLLPGSGHPEDPETGDLTIESSPEEVCHRFLVSLQNGERQLAFGLLTPAAQQATSRASLELDSPGEPGSVFTVMPARYATSERLVAEVDCLFHDPTSPDQSVRLTWVMRNQPNGWKISGMAIDNGDGRPDLLSFENRTDLERIHGSVPPPPRGTPPRSDGR